MLVHAFVLMLGLNPGVVPRVASRTVVPAPFGSCLIYLCGAPNEAVKKKDGWILAKFFFCLFMDRDEVEVHELAQKNEANIQPSRQNKLGQ